VQSRQVGNNWLPLTGLALLFLSGAAADLSTGSDGGSVALHYVFGSMLLAAVTWIWFLRRKPALLASFKAYLYLACAVEFGIFLAGAIEPLRGWGPWLVLGLGLLGYGVLERARILVSAGVVTVICAILAVLIQAPVLPGLLQGVCAIACAAAALRLHAMAYGRRKPRRAIDVAKLFD
jgi:hypothetical protein